MPSELENLKPDDSYMEDEMQVNENIPRDRTTITELMRVLASNARVLQTLNHEVKEFAVSQATLRLTMVSMEEAIKELRKAITATDPASLTIRMVILEREAEAAKEWRKEQEAKHHAEEQERLRAGWQLKIAIGASTLSFISSLVITILSLILKH